jgi:GNAT superfamily N-acetyltransferase
MDRSDVVIRRIDDSLEVRRAAATDLDAIIDVCGRALGWDPAAPNEALFRWKHVDNPFGPSPMWVAVDGGAIVGVRTMLRWQLTDGHRRLRVVRAVDTATLPSHQGRGIFTLLTTAAIDELTAEGVAAVFNTPNDQSRPGYLKMGWRELGAVPIGIRLRTPLTARRLAGARTAADKWGEPTPAGIEPAVALADDLAARRLLDAAPPRRAHRLATDRSVAHLRWRYGLDALHYRAFPLGDAVADGLLLFRVRRRGTLRELDIGDVVVPPRNRRQVRRAVGHLLRRTGCDVAMAGAAEVTPVDGFLPAPRLGPVLTWRPLADRAVPPGRALALTLGTVELF